MKNKDFDEHNNWEGNNEEVKSENDFEISDEYSNNILESSSNDQLTQVKPKHQNNWGIPVFLGSILIAIALLSTSSDDSTVQDSTVIYSSPSPIVSYSPYAAPKYTVPKYTTPSYSSPNYFGNYECTEDCSGHEAGYEWAGNNDIDNYDDCGGNSDSFIEGCYEYVEENYPENVEE